MNKVKYLLTYRYAEIIHDLTVKFTRRYVLSNLSNLGNLRPDFRTADQMDQAARSGKQNIVEGVSKSITSTQGTIKLLGVAKASFEELLTDYEDFLRQNDLEIYPKVDPRVTEFRRLAYRLSALSNLSDLSYLGNLRERPTLFEKPEEDANFLLTLCHLESYLLDKQIKAAEKKFIKEGGYTENLARKRREFRGY